MIKNLKNWSVMHSFLPSEQFLSQIPSNSSVLALQKEQHGRAANSDDCHLSTSNRTTNQKLQYLMALEIKKLDNVCECPGLTYTQLI